MPLVEPVCNGQGPSKAEEADVDVGEEGVQQLGQLWLVVVSTLRDPDLQLVNILTKMVIVFPESYNSVNSSLAYLKFCVLGLRR